MDFLDPDHTQCKSGEPCPSTKILIAFLDSLKQTEEDCAKTIALLTCLETNMGDAYSILIHELGSLHLMRQCLTKQVRTSPCKHSHRVSIATLEEFPVMLDRVMKEVRREFSNGQ